MGDTFPLIFRVQVADVADVDIFSVNEDGDLIVELVSGLEINLGEVVTPGVEPGLIGGDGKVTIVDQTVNEAGNTEYTFSDGTTLEVKKPCTVCETDGGSSLPGSSSGSSGSSTSDRCVQAAATVGIPLLALLPIGLATQVNIPGLSPLVADAQAQLQSFNTNLQQQSGFHDPAIAEFAAQLNAQLQQNGGVIGKAVGAAALIAIGGLVGKYLYDSCVPR